VDSRPIVLVVEDNSLVRIVIANFLEAAGFVVIQAQDGAAAIVVLESGADFQILFTDIQMPGPIDGVGVADLVCDQRPGTPIVLTSGQGVPSRLSPRRRFVAKPYDNRKVVTLLREMIAA
jgi:two-component system, response regulator PdtaR